MSEKDILSKISSKYSLKTIFTYADYNLILKLVKNNKKLQNKLGINIQNYKIKTNYQYIKRKIVISDDPKKMDKSEDIFKYCFSSIITSILFLFVLIYSIVLFSKGSFNYSNTKVNYNKNYLKIIKKINLSLFGFLGYIIISYIIIFVWATSNCYIDTGINIIIKKISLISSIIIYIFYEFIIIFKLYLSYKIKKNITWFMRCDYTLIILIFLYILPLIYITKIYFNYCGNSIQIQIKNILKKFQGVEIEDFHLPDSIKENNFNIKQYILKYKDKYNIKLSSDDIYLINKINKFRISNNMDYLMYNEISRFPYFILDKYSEIYLFEYNNIYRLSKFKYLFKYRIGEFYQKFSEKNNNIINILLIEELKNIQIFKQNNFEFIYVDNSENQYHENDFHSNHSKEERFIRLYRHIDFFDEYYES